MTTKTVDPNNSVGHGGVLFDEGMVLSVLAHTLGGPVLEIGTAMGRSTKFILQGLDPDERVVTVDIRQEVVFNDSRVTQIIGDSRTFESRLSYAWAFVDGDHTLDGVRGDLATLDRLKIPVAVFHDAAGTFWPEVRIALREAADRWTFLDLPTGCGLMIARRR